MPEVYYELLYSLGNGESYRNLYDPTDVEIDFSDTFVRVYDKYTGKMSGAYNKDYVIAVRLIEEEEEEDG